MRMRNAVLAALVVVISASPSNVRAQGGAIVNGAVGVAVVNDATNLEISGGIGYRFNRALGFGLEFTHIPDLDTTSRYGYSALRICCGVGGNLRAEGHATVFTTN